MNFYGSVRNNLKESMSLSSNDLQGYMVIGYNEGVNKIVIIDTDGKKTTQPLGIKGLNVYSKANLGENGCDFSYYNANDGQLHMLDMDYIDKLQLYKDKELIYEITK